MERQALSTFRNLSLAWLGVLLTTACAHATWSIMEVNRSTGEVGIAGASCTSHVSGIGEIVAGKGAVVVQAMSNGEARKLGVKLLQEGATPEQIIEAMRNERFDPENQQYGVIVLVADQSPATYSGKRITGWNGVMTEDDVAVLGNTLVDEKVISAAFAAFHTTRSRSLAERLMAALVAGANAGGDKRCGKQHATAAFLTVYKQPKGDQQLPHFKLDVYGLDKGGQSAVVLLKQEFKRWRKQSMVRRSTEIYTIP
jgi:uncharacterized Ntn-hydrolase superfamily protein